MYEPQEEHLEELSAQIESHSASDVRFYLVDAEKEIPVYITDVAYINGEIRVDLAK